jgi:hypothetical protein
MKTNLLSGMKSILELIFLISVSHSFVFAQPHGFVPIVETMKGLLSAKWFQNLRCFICLNFIKVARWNIQKHPYYTDCNWFFQIVILVCVLKSIMDVSSV